MKVFLDVVNKVGKKNGYHLNGRIEVLPFFNFPPVSKNFRCLAFRKNFWLC